MKSFLPALLFILLALPTWSQTSWKEKDTENNKIEKQLKVYPNPCKTNKVTVDFSTKEISEIRIMNITGKEVLHTEYIFPVHKTQLLLNQIPNGIYLLQIKTIDNKAVVKKLMISRH